MNTSIFIVATDIDRAPWTDAKGAPAGVIERICRIPKGTNQGNAAVAVLIKLEDGSMVIGQTTLELMKVGIAALVAAEKGDR